VPLRTFTHNYSMPIYLLNQSFFHFVHSNSMLTPHGKGAVKPSNRRPNNTPAIKPFPFQLIPYTSLFSRKCLSLNTNMKYILAGTSGFIGSEILAHCLSNPLITSLLILSRRPLPDIKSRDPRINVVVLDDFLTYPESVKSEFSGVKAVLW